MGYREKTIPYSSNNAVHFRIIPCSFQYHRMNSHLRSEVFLTRWPACKRSSACHTAPNVAFRPLAIEDGLDAPSASRKANTSSEVSPSVRPLDVSPSNVQPHISPSCQSISSSVLGTMRPTMVSFAL